MLRTRAQGWKARDRIGEGGREAEKRKKPQMSCRHGMENGETWAEIGKKRRQESVGSVTADPDNLES